MCATHPTVLLGFLKLYRCLDHALKIYMWFKYTPLIILTDILTMEVNCQWVHCVNTFSYSFIPIILKLHVCLDHALKICVWFGYNPQIFDTFSQFELHRFSGIRSEWTVGTLCAQLLLQFYPDSFET